MHLYVAAMNARAVYWALHKIKSNCAVKQTTLTYLLKLLLAHIMGTSVMKMSPILEVWICVLNWLVKIVEFCLS